MAILRDQIVNYNAINYVASLALFCVISCTILMLRFGGFKANFNLVTGKRVTSDYYDDIPTISSTTGAYRTNRDELYKNVNISGPPKKLDPSMVKLPPSSKSTGNLSQAVNQFAVIPATSTPNLYINEKENKEESTTKAQETVKQKDTKPANNKVNATKVPPNSANTPPYLAKSTSNVSSIHKKERAPKPQGSTNQMPVTNQSNLGNTPPNLSKSTTNVSTNPKGDSVPQASVTQSKVPMTNQGNPMVLDKKALAAQKKAEKLAAQERATQEKLRKQQEAKEAKERKAQEAQQLKQRKLDEKTRKQMEAKQVKERKAREKLEAQQAKKNKGKAVNNPLAQPRANIPAQGSQQSTTSTVPKPPSLPNSAPPKTTQSTTNATQNTSQYSTNTLESSISKTSGPPAYSEINKVQNKNDNTGNISFGKPIQETSTWDMVSQHRQEINRPPVSGASATRKHTVLDLEYPAQTGMKSLHV